MNAMLHWFGLETGQALILALAHSLWIGGVLAGATALCLRLIPARQATLRYGIALSAQAILVGATILAWSLLSETGGPGGRPAAPGPSPAAASEFATDRSPRSAPDRSPAPAEASAPSPQSVPAAPPPAEPWAPWAGATWVAGTLGVLSARLLGYWRTRRLCQAGTPVDAGPWRSLLEQEQRLLGYHRAVALRAIEGWSTPAVFGFFRPVILIPDSMISGLPTETIRAVLIHELAHLQRWDPLVRTIQEVFEAALFFNPFMWTLSHRIALEREACCDALAANQLEAASYAQVLVDIGRRSGAPPAAAVAASGDRSPHSLGERVRRILDPGMRPAPRFSSRLLLLALAIAAASVFAGRQVADAAVAAMSHAGWIERIQSTVEQERRENLPAEWVPGDEVRVTGTVLDADGQPMPNAEVYLRMFFADGSPGMRTFTAVDDQTGAFQRKLDLVDWPSERPFGAMTLQAFAPGRQPSALQRVPTQTGVATFDFRLEKGIPARLAVRNEAGEPVANATATVAYIQENTTALKTAYSTNADGRVSFFAPRDTALRIDVQAEGYRDADGLRRQFSEPNQSIEITLNKGKPIRGLVRDAVTGEPIADAGVFRIHSVSLDGTVSRGRSFWVGDDDPLTTTGPEGEFEIDSLSADFLHWLVIQKEGYLVGFPGDEDSRDSRNMGPAVAVTPGDETWEINLIPQRKLEVVILPPNGWPVDPESKQSIRYSHSYSTGLRNGPRSSAGSVFKRRPAALTEGVIQLRLEPTIAAPLRIGLNRNRGPEKIIEGWRYGEPVVVDLRDQPAVTTAEIEYRIRFALEKGAPPAEGALNVGFVDAGYVLQERRIPIVDGQAQFTVRQRLDRPLEFDARGVIGYDFDPVHLTPPETPPDQPIEHVIKDAKPAGALKVMLQNLDPSAETQIAVNRIPAFWRLGAEPKPLWPEQRIIKLPPGESELLLSPVPFGVKLGLEIRNGNLEFDPSPVTLGRNESLATKTIRLPEGITFTGQVIGPNGAPAPGVNVNLNRVHELTPRSYHTSHFWTQTGPDGRFRFERINPKAGGVFFVQVNNVAGAADYARIIKTIDQEQTLRLPPSSELRVRVLNARNQEPLPGLNLEAYPAAIPSNRRFLRQTITAALPTDSDGWTRFMGLPQTGEYAFRVWIPVGDNGRTAATVEHDLPPAENGSRAIVIEIDPQR